MKAKTAVEEACDKAYKEAGHNAYFANGFYAGVEYAAQFREPSIADKWIPVSERLPESAIDVLCLMYSQYGNKKPIQFVGCYTKGHEIEYCDDDYQGEYDEIEDKNGTLYLKPGWYECEETPGANYDEQWIKREVVAWQPLPPPPGSIAEQPGEQDRIKELEQALSASERIRMSDAQSAIREANSLRGRIQQLEQEIERLNELITDKTILLDAAKIGCNQRDERIKVLEDALREIERYDGVNSHHASWGDVVSHLQRVARKALTTSQPKDV